MSPTPSWIVLLLVGLTLNDGHTTGLEANIPQSAIDSLIKTSFQGVRVDKDSERVDRDPEKITHPRNALFWSEFHKSDTIEKEYIGKVAVLITGLMRFSDEEHFSKLETALNGSDAFVATYSAYKSLGFRLTNDVIIISEEELKEEREQRGEPQPGMWQWYLLGRALSFWRGRLLVPGAYRTIVRLRTDLQIPVSFRFHSCIGRVHNESQVGIVYAQSDSMFYADPRVFYEVFSSMFSASRTQYVLINETETQKRWYSEKVREFGGFRPSCMTGVNFAPEPREASLKTDQQATLMFPKCMGRSGVGGGGMCKNSKERSAPRSASLHRRLLEFDSSRPSSRKWSRARQKFRAQGGSKPSSKQLTATAFETDAGVDIILSSSSLETPDDTGSSTGGPAAPRFSSKMGIVSKPRAQATPANHVKGLVRMYCGCKWGLGQPGPDRIGGVGWTRPSAKTRRRYQTEPAMAYQILSHNASCLPLDLPHREVFGLYQDRASFEYEVDEVEGLRASITDIREDSWDDEDDDDALVSFQSKSTVRDRWPDSHAIDESTPLLADATGTVYTGDDMSLVEGINGGIDEEKKTETQELDWRHPRNALYWSELHSTNITVEESPGKVAVLVTGVLRFSDETHFSTLVSAVDGSSAFVITYSAYASLGFRLTNDVIIISEEELKEEREQRGEPQPGMWQWYLLGRALSFWRGRLLVPGAYRTIVRLRTDLQIPVSFRFHSCIGRVHNESQVGIVYAQSDSMFYADPRVFYEVFSSMFSVSRTQYVLVNATESQQEWYSEKVREFGGFRPTCMADVRYAPEPRDILLNPNRQATVLFAKPGSNINISEETGLTVPSRRNLREKTDNSPIASSPTKKQNSKTENRDAGANGFVKRKPRGDKPSKTVSRPNARSGERKKKKNRSSKKSQSRFHGTHDNPNWVRLYCGCKWGVGHPGAKRLHEGVGWKRGQAASGRRYQTEPAMAYQILSHNASCLPLDLPHREVFEPYKDRASFHFGVDPLKIQKSFADRFPSAVNFRSRGKGKEVEGDDDREEDEGEEGDDDGEDEEAGNGDDDFITTTDADVGTVDSTFEDLMGVTDNTEVVPKTT